MTTEAFVKEFYLLKKELSDNAFNVSSGTAVAAKIATLNLDDITTSKLKNIISVLLDDAFYTILLGLDGAAQIGVTQEDYKVLDSEGNELTSGDIETFAWEYFHHNKKDE